MSDALTRSLFYFLFLSGIINASRLSIIKLRKNPICQMFLRDQSSELHGRCLSLTTRVTATRQVSRSLRLNRDLSLYLSPQLLCSSGTTAFYSNKASSCASCHRGWSVGIIWLVHGYEWLCWPQPETSLFHGKCNWFPCFATCHSWQSSPESYIAWTQLGLLWWWDGFFNHISAD